MVGAGFKGRVADRVAHLVEVGQSEPLDTTTALVTDLVVVAEFRDQIYPGSWRRAARNVARRSRSTR